MRAATSAASASCPGALPALWPSSPASCSRCCSRASSSAAPSAIQASLSSSPCMSCTCAWQIGARPYPEHHPADAACFGCTDPTMRLQLCNGKSSVTPCKAVHGCFMLQCMHVTLLDVEAAAPAFMQLARLHTSPHVMQCPAPDIRWLTSASCSLSKGSASSECSCSLGPVVPLAGLSSASMPAKLAWAAASLCLYRAEPI